MSFDSDQQLPIDALAEKYIEAVRDNADLSQADFIEMYPALADEIRELFPVIKMMNRAVKASSTFGALNDQEPAADLTGVSLGNYSIIREIGRGGMGVVYEATHATLNRRVALKVLAQRFNHGSTRERFEREARAAAGLHHTNIVPVFEYGQADQTPFYAMQFIEGCGLDQIIRQILEASNSHMPTAGRSIHGTGRDADGSTTLEADIRTVAAEDSDSSHVASSHSMVASSVQMDLNELQIDYRKAAFVLSDSGSDSKTRTNGDKQPDSNDTFWVRIARLGQQAAEGLQYAHTNGVLHRDIKPANLILDVTGNLWVADFGLAKSLGDSDLTETGKMVGTLRYMSPESLTGRADERSDIFCLGLTLFELVAMRPAYDSSDRGELLKQVSRASPRPLGAFCPQIPVDLRTIIHKSIEAQPELRYQNASELADDLQRFCLGQPISARPLSSPAKLRRWIRQSPLIATLVFSCATLLIVGTVVSSYFAFLANANSSRAFSNERIAKSQTSIARKNAAEAIENANRFKAEKERATELRNQAELLFYSTRLNSSWQEAEAGRFDLARRELQVAPWRFQGWEYRAVESQIQRDSQALFSSWHDIQSVVVDEPNNRLIVGDNRDLLTIWDRKEKEVQFQARVRTPIFRIQTTSDEHRMIVFSQQRGLKELDTSNGIGEMRPKFVNLPLMQAHFFEEANTLVANINNRLTFYEFDSEQVAKEVPYDEKIVSWNAHYRSNHIVVLAKTLDIWDVEKRQRMHSLTTDAGAIRYVGLSGDGQQVITVDNKLQVIRIDVNSGKEISKNRIAAKNVVLTRYHARANRIATLDKGGTIKIWDADTLEFIDQTGSFGRTIRESQMDSEGRYYFACDHLLWSWFPNGRQNPAFQYGQRSDICFKLRMGSSGKFLFSEGIFTNKWDSKSGELLFSEEFEGNGGYFSNDGALVAGQKADGTYGVWNTVTGETLFQSSEKMYSGYDSVFTKDNKIIYRGLDTGGIQQIDVTNGTSDYLISPPDTPAKDTAEVYQTIVLTPDEKTLVATTGVGLRRVEIATGKVTRMPVYRKTIDYFHIDEATNTLLTSGKGQVAIWDLDTFELKRIVIGNATLLTTAIYDPSRTRIVTSDIEGKIQFWDVDTGILLWTINPETPSLRSGMTFSKDGNSLLVGVPGYEVKVIRADTSSSTKHIVADTLEVLSLRASNNEKHLWVSLGSGTVKQIELETGTTTREIRRLSAKNMDVSEDGNKIAFTVDGRGGVFMKEPWEHQKLFNQEGFEWRPMKVALDQNGDRLAILRPGSQQVFDTGTHQLVWEHEEPKMPTYSLDYFANDRYLLSHGDLDLIVFDAVDGSIQLRFPTGYNRSIHASSNSDLVAVVDNDQRLSSFSVSNGSGSKKDFGIVPSASRVAVSDDGRLIAVGTRTSIVHVFAADSAEKIASKTFEHHVTAMKILSDNQTIVVGQKDGTLSVWDCHK